MKKNTNFLIIASLMVAGFCCLQLAAAQDSAGDLAGDDYATLTGYVYGPDGAPAPGVWVNLYSKDYSTHRMGESDSTGLYTIGKFYAGTYFVDTNPSGEMYLYTEPETVEITIGPGETYNLDLHFTGSVANKKIYGNVTYSDGSAVSDAKIDAYQGDNWQHEYTDSSGYYSLYLEGGDWKVSVYPQYPDTADWEYHQEASTVSFSDDDSEEEQQLNFTVTSNVVLPTQAGVQGTVTDNNGQPFSGVWVKVYTADYSFEAGDDTDSQGNYMVAGLEPGSYYVAAYAPDTYSDLIEPSPEFITVAEGETATVNLQFTEAVKEIIGSVKFSNGTPVTDARVYAFKENEPGQAEALVDAAGNYSLSVGGGTWMVRPEPQDQSTANWSYTQMHNRS